MGTTANSPAQDALLYVTAGLKAPMVVPNLSADAPLFLVNKLYLSEKTRDPTPSLPSVQHTIHIQMPVKLWFVVAPSAS